jgi:hypothetical protein
VIKTIFPGIEVVHQTGTGVTTPGNSSTGRAVDAKMKAQSGTTGMSDKSSGGSKDSMSKGGMKKDSMSK